MKIDLGLYSKTDEKKNYNMALNKYRFPMYSAMQPY